MSTLVSKRTRLETDAGFETDAGSVRHVADAASVRIELMDDATGNSDLG